MKPARLVIPLAIVVIFAFGELRAKADWVDMYGKTFPTAADACSFHLKELQHRYGQRARVTLSMTYPYALPPGQTWHSPTCFFTIMTHAGPFGMEITIEPSCGRGLKRDRSEPSGCTSLDCGADSLLPSPPATAHLCSDVNLPFNYNKNSENYHEYQDFTKVCTAAQSSNCTIDNVFNTLLHTPAAIAPVVSTVQERDIKSCRVLELRSCPGSDNEIRIVIDHDQHSVTNYTLPGHIFYPGEVTRRIVDQSGVIEIETVGKGVGCKKATNIEGGTCKIWPDADQTLRIAVWKELNLGEPPPIPPVSSICRSALSFIMWTCDFL